MSRVQDLFGVMKGIQQVVKAGTQLQAKELRNIWENSSLRELSIAVKQELDSKLHTVTTNPGREVTEVAKNVKETIERIDVLLEGIKRYTLHQYNIKPKRGNTDFPPLSLKDIEVILTENSQLRDRKFNWERDRPDKKSSMRLIQDIQVLEKNNNDEITQGVKHDNDKAWVDGVPPAIQINSRSDLHDVYGNIETTPRSISEHASEIPALSSVARQRTVPSSRIARLMSFGGLAAGLGIGTMSQLTKGALGLGGSNDIKSAFLSPENTQRIVDTLCKVRGAALKLGQILSMQDANVVSPQLAAAFERVRQSADYMPSWQVEKVMKSELGEDWRNMLGSFDELPFAAASIGQVHRAELLTGLPVAIKIQYPGVAKGIESDIDNLVGLLKVWNVFPKGVFIDKVVNVAKRELAWEVDYNREALFTERYRNFVQPYPEYKVPQVIEELSTRQVLTTELVSGLTVDQCFDLPSEDRHIIAEAAMKLCLRELFIFRCMQTDPNWSNFLYDVNNKKLTLLDFGACRDYSKIFIDQYISVIKAATINDREAILSLSKDMGFLTGYETKAMRDAHTDAVMILGEVFSCQGRFDFGAQSTTKRITQLVPIMLSHRLCPPPDEIYSLHRKLSGVFLLCSKLNVQLGCKEWFEEIYMQYEFGDV